MLGLKLIDVSQKEQPVTNTELVCRMYYAHVVSSIKDKIIYVSYQQTSAGAIQQDTGGRLNKKDGLTRYGNSHVKDKTS